jgi:glycosyltransferase involved in cell wall biosynthesis
VKVLFIANDPAIFEAHSASRGRMRMYAEAIGELHVLSCANPGAMGGREHNLYLYPVIGSKFTSLFTFPRRAHRLVREHGIDVVSAEDPFEHGWVARRAVLGTTAKLHIQIHIDFLSPCFVRESLFHRARVRFATRYVLPHADGIRVVSERVKASLAARYGASLPSPSVIPISISRDVPANAPLPPHRFSFSCLAIGRLSPEKRQEDLLAALAIVRRTHPGVGLFIAGAGRSRRRLERRARSLLIEDCVVFLGHRNDVRSILPASDLFVQASVYEGYGATFVEAALTGTPIVSTDVGIMGEVFQAGVNALICPPGDVQCLAREITRLIEQEDLRRSLACCARAAVEEHLQRMGDVFQRAAEELSRMASV